MPLTIIGLDSITIGRFCALCDEREQALAAWNEHGVLLEEPIVSPTGKVCGTRFVPNPSAAILRAIDKELTALCVQLALTPASRARLGLTVTSSERQALEVDEMLRRKFKDVK